MARTNTSKVRITEENSAPVHGFDPQRLPLTDDHIGACIAAAMGNLVAAFTELEDRAVADNGKIYPLDATLPEGVSHDGEIVTVNKYGFVAKQVASTVCWKLETMIDQADERIGVQKGKIKDAVRQLSSGRVTEQLIERMADYLETMVEQRCVLVAAYASARDVYEAELGEAYETKAMRADKARAAQSSRTGSTLDARLAKLLG